MMKYITGMLGVLCFAALGYEALHIVQKKSSLIKVYGLADIVLESDMADLSIKIQEEGNDIKSASDKMQNAIITVAHFLKKQGYDNSEISENATEILDKYPTYYREKKYNKDIEKPNTRYDLTKSITIRTKKIDKVKTTLSNISDLLNEGLFVTTHVSYSCSDYDQIRVKLVQEATADSLARANAIANVTNSKITGLYNLSTGRLKILSADNNTDESSSWSDGEQSFRKRFRMIVEANYGKD